MEPYNDIRTGWLLRVLTAPWVKFTPAPGLQEAEIIILQAIFIGANIPSAQTY